MENTLYYAIVEWIIITVLPTTLIWSKLLESIEMVEAPANKNSVEMAPPPKFCEFLINLKYDYLRN